MNKKRILIIASHPDDEVLGCGGTVARLVKEGHEAYTLILGEGVTSRDKNRLVKKRNRELKDLKIQALKANEILSIKQVIFHNFPDNRFDTVPFLDIVKVIEKEVNNIKPHVVFTHYERDLNIDHRITYQAVLTAARPLPDATVKEIYSFEILSSTEYYYPSLFSPNVFVDISNDIDIKIQALKAYKFEIREFLHPRSPHGITSHAQYRGMQVGLHYAEAFQLIRTIK